MTKSFKEHLAIIAKLIEGKTDKDLYILSIVNTSEHIQHIINAEILRRTITD